jgi:hypothetical protein
MAIDYSSYSPSRPSEQDSTGSLFSRLFNDASALFRNEIALAKSELHEAAMNAKLGLAALAIASVVLLAGAMSLIAAAILGLAEVMQPWAAALLVGAVLAIIGIAMFLTAKRKLSATRRPLPRTQTSLQQDAAVLARRGS